MGASTRPRPASAASMAALESENASAPSTAWACMPALRAQSAQLGGGRCVLSQAMPISGSASNCSGVRTGQGASNSGAHAGTTQSVKSSAWCAWWRDCSPYEMRKSVSPLCRSGSRSAPTSRSCGREAPCAACQSNSSVPSHLLATDDRQLTVSPLSVRSRHRLCCALRKRSNAEPSSL